MHGHLKASSPPFFSYRLLIARCHPGVFWVIVAGDKSSLCFFYLSEVIMWGEHNVFMIIMDGCVEGGGNKGLRASLPSRK